MNATKHQFENMQGAAIGHENYAVGIDVGGTKVAAGIVNLKNGHVSARRQIDTNCQRGAAPLLADVEELAHKLIEEAAQSGIDLRGLGLGVAELVSPDGAIFSGHRIQWKGLDVAGHLSSLLPTRVNSDVRAAALAEARFGAGVHYDDFIYVTVGTGVSAVLVQDGIPYAGSRGAALVIGNGPTFQRCDQCGSETMYILEDVASGPSIAAAFGATVGADEVLAAADTGDARAIKVIDHAAQALGQVLALLVNSLDPEAVIVGGGLGCAPSRYWNTLQASIRTGLWQKDLRPLSISQAALGADAGLIGAAAGVLMKSNVSKNHNTRTGIPVISN